MISTLRLLVNQINIRWKYLLQYVCHNCKLQLIRSKDNSGNGINLWSLTSTSWEMIDVYSQDDLKTKNISEEGASIEMQKLNKKWVTTSSDQGKCKVFNNNLVSTSDIVHFQNNFLLQHQYLKWEDVHVMVLDKI